MRRVWAVLLLLGAGVTAAPPAGAATVAEEVRRLAPDPGRAVRVGGFSLQAGLATVVLEDGVLVPSTPVAGRPVELAFIGRGRVELEPPDRVEAHQLELFTGRPSLAEPFERAVFVVTLDAAVDAVLGRPAAAEDPAAASAAALYRSWLGSTERALLDVDARIFADGVGDPLASGTFCAALDGTRLGRFLVMVDPLADEQLTVGQFVRPELTRRDERRSRRALEAAQRTGKLIGLTVDDLGVWDTWVSAGLRSSDGEPTPGTTGVEPAHYRLEATLRGTELALEGFARIELRTLVAGLRAVVLDLSADLEPVSVADGRGRELTWWRSRNELAVALAEPAAAGDAIELVVGYRGRPVQISGEGVPALRDPVGWYPHAGTIDRATYELELAWPAGFEVVAPGAREELPPAGGGLERRRWRLDRPALGTSFEIGRFTSATGRAGAVAVEVALPRSERAADDARAAEILATVIDSVEFYQELFGELPLERLEVVGSPRGFSQGLLGLITLSAGTVTDWREWGDVLGLEDRRTVIAHEVAHQWWGNLVGWRSYRDQWISEAAANWAAQLWAERRLDRVRGEEPVRGPTAGWQSDLLEPTGRGRPVESLGPLVVGARLRSSLSRDAYVAIVYMKGAVVLNTLAVMLGEDAFVRVLSEIAAAASGRVLSTEQLLAAVEELAGIDLDGFSRRYVFGTGLAEIVHTSTINELDGGRWELVGEALQRPPVTYRYRVAAVPAGGLDVGRRGQAAFDVSGSRLVVPVQVGVATDDGRAIVDGRIPVGGRTSRFRLELDRRPQVLWLDGRAEVFGRFVDADRLPRLAGYLRGLELEAFDSREDARAALEAALDDPVAVVPPGWEPVLAPADPESEGRRLDARIRLALARLHLDAGRLREAASELAAARDLVASRDRWLLAAEVLAVQSRLDLLSGADKRAFRRLRDEVLGRGGVETPETWALLAVAAAAVGDSEVLDMAAGRAARLGVDLGPLAAGERPGPG